jgi:LytS/YehU family sensor histidine kinase
VEKRRQPTAITLSVQRQQDTLVLRVEDDAGLLPAATPAAGSAAAAAGGADADRSASIGVGGIGVRNLRERLAALYGDRAAFDLIQLSPAGVRAEVRLPCAC